MKHAVFFGQIFHLLAEKEYEQYGNSYGIYGPLHMTERKHHGQAGCQRKQHVSQQGGGIGLVNQLTVQEKSRNHRDKSSQDGECKIPHRRSNLRS